MKRVFFLIAVTALVFLSGSACESEPYTTGEMTAYGFLCAVVPPSKRFQSDDGSLWCGNTAYGEGLIVTRVKAMKEIPEERLSNDVVYELGSVSSTERGVSLAYSVYNGSDIDLRPRVDTRLAVRLKDGWYIVPHLDYEADTIYDLEYLRSGETMDCSLRLGGGEDSYLPDGHYRLQLRMGENDIPVYAVLEFDLESSAGDIRVKK